jgi:hypothetical protein
MQRNTLSLITKSFQFIALIWLANSSRVGAYSDNESNYCAHTNPDSAEQNRGECDSSGSGSGIAVTGGIVAGVAAFFMIAYLCEYLRKKCHNLMTREQEGTISQTIPQERTISQTIPQERTISQTIPYGTLIINITPPPGYIPTTSDTPKLT